MNTLLRHYQHNYQRPPQPPIEEIAFGKGGDAGIRNYLYNVEHFSPRVDCFFVQPIAMKKPGLVEVKYTPPSIAVYRRWPNAI
jgi:hypothetical protein